MKLSNYLTPERVTLLSSSTKDDVIREMAELVVASGKTGDAESLVEAIEHREKLMSTGIGHGIAVPHVRMESVTEPVMAVGVRLKGIGNWESLDEQPVRLVVMIAAPKGEHETYIRLLSLATGVLKNPACRKAIIEAQKPEDAYRIMTEGS